MQTGCNFENIRYYGQRICYSKDHRLYKVLSRNLNAGENAKAGTDTPVPA